MAKYFNEGLFHCMDDMFSCGVAFFVPCGSALLQSYVSDWHLSHGKVLPFCLGCWCPGIGPAINRGLIREKLNIYGNFYTDCMVWCFCPPCSATQEYRESIIFFRNQNNA